jgi:hypothetical protein
MMAMLVRTHYRYARVMGWAGVPSYYCMRGRTGGVVVQMKDLGISMGVPQRWRGHIAWIGGFLACTASQEL